MRPRALAALVLALVVVAVLSGPLPVAAYCPRSVQSFQVSQTTTFLGICLKVSHVGGCDVYTYELPFLRD